jgi:5-methylcytosine-specific restriction endonuclease McrA
MCNLNNKNPKLATVDHKVPVSSGIDKLDVTNWVVACKKCNNRKGSKSYEEFKKNHLKK